MTEAQAWKTIFDAYSTPRGERTAEQWDLARGGVCAAISKMLEGTKMMANTYLSMRKSVYSSLPHNSAYFCNYSPANDLLRADWCLLQYYICGGK